MVLTLAQELEPSYIRSQRTDFQWPNTYRPHKYFEWVRLKKICEKYQLEESYQIYQERIFRNYVLSFMILHLCIGSIHSIAVSLRTESCGYCIYDSIYYFVGAVLVCLCLAPYTHKGVVHKYPFLSYIVSVLATLTLVLTDSLPALVGYVVNNDKIMTCYMGYTVSAVYLFMPIKSLLHTIVLGGMVSLAYALCAYNSAVSFDIDLNPQFELYFFVPDILFLVGLNIVGAFFRTRQEFRRRQFFLTKCLNVEENLLLKHARAHEQNLLHTIIPIQIAKKIEEDIKNRIEKTNYLTFFKNTQLSAHVRKLFIEAHYNVSILFADVVNYTYLTTKLDVKTLVETLHELFQRFDSACDDFDCMRIKFLGDCYYCVSGVPQSHPFHALCCTELGRSIIKHVGEVRASRSLDIDMRIGVHSGNILSGIIGNAKWQYDIWSKDVDIASHLEQTGVPGRVHVSASTLNMMEGYYNVENGTEKAKNDPLLMKERINTYLIIEPSELMTTSLAWQQFMDAHAKMKFSQPNIRPSKHLSPRNGTESKKMDYASIRAKANDEIRRKVQTIPVCKLSLFEKCFKRMPRLAANQMEDHKASENISACCLWYDNMFWETKYNRGRDEFFRMSVLGAVLGLWCLMGMQASNRNASIFSLTPGHEITFTIIYSVLLTFSMVILIVTWFHAICNKIHKYPFYRPRKNITRFFYRNSILIESTCQARTLIYISLVICSLLATLVHLISCDQNAIENDDDLIEEMLNGGRRVKCFDAWAVSEGIGLCLALTMTFSHIPHCLQFTLGVFIIVYYGIIIFLEFSIVYEWSLVTNQSIKAEYGHLWGVVVVFCIYQLMNRHTIFLSRIDTYTKWHVNNKRRDAKVANESITMLLHNILPSHVVNVYLSKRLRNEPYYEKHEFTAVMFATIIYSRSGSLELRLLNEIICDFDEVLNYYKGAIKVEKIKVASWSYMAACGFNIFSFDPDRYSAAFATEYRNVQLTKIDISESYYNVYKKRSSISVPVKVESESDSGDEDEELYNVYINEQMVPEQTDEWKEAQKKKVVNVMAHFALDLLRVMKVFNGVHTSARGNNEPPIKLRIGISCGEVMAGVVGSSQAHYDIWGNAVNMASRMDSTGIPGRIQVTEDAAEFLKALNIACTYRGETYVKGRGTIPTYFVEVDNNMNFEAISRNDPTPLFQTWFK